MAQQPQPPPQQQPPLPNFNRMNQAFQTIIQELSYLQNIPNANVIQALQTGQQNIQQTLNVIQQNMTTMQQNMTAMQQNMTVMQQTMQMTLATIQQNIQIVDTRSYYRSVNSRITGENEAIIALPNFQNAYPNPFPINVRNLRGLTGQNLDTLLAFYGLQVTGGLDARQKCLAKYLGIKLL
ncbi:unnamed protein product [Rhizophagus irregularis]|uniref:Uncharacterized protein n=1 Tax=Rhizophagus irregularis TaxID=588596 RepID=A0A2I1F6P9_9GLOM|nr:hypothetical protein RhiirB3_392259 [Rhizophagus irregularis]CAB4495766.1 unnamed protein product [Rhizophagus irregularis]CAB5394777.1 unnamed protein product [Rhizophagus irregularis]